ncbi:hypothetical protein Emed_004309 [Eimeria media]
MAPLARQGLCALLAVGVVNAAGALAGTRTESGRDNIEASGPRDQSDQREAGVDQVRAGLRGTLDSLRNRANGSEKIDSSSALGEALSEAATIELAAVALSSINTFWMSLTPAARSELLQELGSGELKSDGEILIIPSPDDDEEDKDESDSEKEDKKEDDRDEAAAAPSSSQSARGRQLRQNREDSALLRVLQRLGNSRQGVLSTTSTSTMKPMSSTTIAVSAGSSTIEIEAGDASDEEEDIEVVEFDFGDSEEQKKFEDKSLDKIHKHLADIDLDEADILLAFRAFIRRYSQFLGAYKERLIAFVDSEEFSSEVAKLKGAIRDHDKKHGIKRNTRKIDEEDNKDEKKHEKHEKKEEKKHHHHGRGEMHHHSSTTSTSTVAIEGVPTTMVAIGASTTTTTPAPEDVSTTLIATLVSTVPATSTSTAAGVITTTVPAVRTTLPAPRTALTAAAPRL